MFFRVPNDERINTEFFIPESLWKEITSFLGFSDFASLARVNKISNKVAQELFPVFLKKLPEEKRQSILEKFLKVEENRYTKSKLEMDIEYSRQVGRLTEELREKEAKLKAERKAEAETLHPHAAKIVEVFLKSGVTVTDKILQVFVREEWFNLIELAVDRNQIKNLTQEISFPTQEISFPSYYIHKKTLLYFACLRNQTTLAIKLLNKNEVMVPTHYNSIFSEVMVPYYGDIFLISINNLAILKEIRKKIGLDNFAEFIFSYCPNSPEIKEYFAEQKAIYLNNPSDVFMALRYAFKNEDHNAARQLLNEQKEKIRNIFADRNVLSDFIFRIKDSDLIQMLLETDLISTLHWQQFFAKEHVLLDFILDSRSNIEDPNYEFITLFAKKNIITSKAFSFIYKSCHEYPEHKQRNNDTHHKLLFLLMGNAPLAVFLNYAKTEITNLKGELKEEHDKANVIWMHFDGKQEKMDGLDTLLNKIYEDPDVNVEDHLKEIEKKISSFRKPSKSKVAELCRNLIEKQNEYFELKEHKQNSFHPKKVLNN